MNHSSRGNLSRIIEVGLGMSGLGPRLGLHVWVRVKATGLATIRVTGLPTIRVTGLYRVTCLYRVT